MFNTVQLLLGLALGLAATAAESPSKLAVAYAPSSGSCPAGTRLLRTTSPSNGSLNDQEQDFIGRKKNLNATVTTYLNSLADYAKNHATNATLPAYLTPNNSQPLTPRIGLAVSGGGYRAAIFGLSVLHALDGRNESSNAAGLGGILQSSLYMAGLSGGSWALGSLAQANFPTIPSVFFGPSANISEAANSNGNGVWGGWNAEVDIIPSNLSFAFDLIGGLEAKARQFPVTFADIWSLALARHFMNGTTQANFNDGNSSIHGAGVLFSSVADLPSAQNGSMPFPIFVLNSRMQDTPNAQIPFVPLNNTLFEITPYEFGSWDPGLSSFTPTKFLGSTNSSRCVTGFEKLPFVIGTSSNLFNEFNTSDGSLAQSSIGPLIAVLNSTLLSNLTAGAIQGEVELDTAIWPNPFKGQNSSSFAESNQEVLTLVDGGEDGEVIPLAPLAVKARALDVIFAIDASSDAGGFARGVSMVSSINRTLQDPSKASVYQLPPMPTSTTPFISTSQGGQGLGQRPTFFGCGNFTSGNGQQVSSGGGTVPLVVYIPNGAAPPGQAPVTNTTTGQTVYTDPQLSAFFDQAVQIATQGFSGDGNTTKDADWPICLACAIFEPSRARSGNVPRDQTCETCFTRYCWNGTYPTGAISSSGGGNGQGQGSTGAGSSLKPSFGDLSSMIALTGLVAVLSAIAVF